MCTQLLLSKHIPTVPSLYCGWYVRGGCVNSKLSSVELWLEQRNIFKMPLKACSSSKLWYKNIIDIAMIVFDTWHIPMLNLPLPLCKHNSDNYLLHHCQRQLVFQLTFPSVTLTQACVILFLHFEDVCTRGQNKFKLDNEPRIWYEQITTKLFVLQSKVFIKNLLQKLVFSNIKTNISFASNIK